MVPIATATTSKGRKVIILSRPGVRAFEVVSYLKNTQRYKNIVYLVNPLAIF